MSDLECIVVARRASIGGGQDLAVRCRVVRIAVLVIEPGQERILRGRPDQPPHVVLGKAVGARGIGDVLDLPSRRNHW